MSLLGIEDLAVRLRTTPNALYCRRARDPYSLPPRIKIPGDKRYLFDEHVVDAWLADPTAFLPEDRKPKRQGGRPRKHDAYVAKAFLPAPKKVSAPAPDGVKRGRGRPRKVQQVQGVQP
jgi:hypothetical protein